MAEIDEHHLNLLQTRPKLPPGVPAPVWVIRVTPDDADPWVLGRGRTSDGDGIIPAIKRLVLANPAISREHCLVQFDYEEFNCWQVADRGSRNGTYLNGNKLTPYQWVVLQPNDTLQIVDRQFYVLDETNGTMGQQNDVATDPASEGNTSASWQSQLIQAVQQTSTPRLIIYCALAGFLGAIALYLWIE